jgi:C-terminal processing protease CtpA/Prc
VHITVSRYLTPGGSDINKVGVAPDITVNEKSDQMKVALAYMKEKIASLKPSKGTLKPGVSMAPVSGSALATK